MNSNLYNQYFCDKSRKLRKHKGELRNILSKEIPLLPNQYCYIHNLADNCFEDVNGVDAVLGYKNRDFTLPFYYKQLHPDDTYLIFETTKKAYAVAESNGLSDCHNTILTVLFRIKKANEKYAHILRLSKVAAIADDKIAKTISVCTDVTNLFLIKQVALDFGNYEHLNFGSRKLLVDSKGHQTKDLTARELLILELISTNHSSKSIAETLSISLTTVHTHRRNIIKKTGFRNLFAFAQEFFAKGFEK